MSISLSSFLLSLKIKEIRKKRCDLLDLSFFFEVEKMADTGSLIDDDAPYRTQESFSQQQKARRDNLVWWIIFITMSLLGMGITRAGIPLADDPPKNIILKLLVYLCFEYALYSVIKV